ncbi:hypothetical protein M413DRAFT_77348, partial [Hebeloma cylindrosporum]
HRPMQPSATRTNTAPGPPQLHTGPSFSLNDALDAIKREYNSLASEVVGMRNQRDELEAKLELQMTELTSVRRSLFDLEAKYGRVRQQYEEEVTLMRAELLAIREQRSSGNSNVSIGIPGLRNSSHPKSSDPSSNFSSLSDQQQSQQGRSFTRDRPASALDRDHASEREVDTERIADPRDPKRHKARRDLSGISFPPRPDSPVPPPSSFNNSHTLGLHRFHQNGTPGPGGSSALPPMKMPPPEELTLHNVPPEYRKEGQDWCAVFNPKVKKVLDVNLMHHFVHATVVCCVQFSADGRYVATGCNRTAQIFDVQTGQKVCVLEDETAPKAGDLYIRSIRFSPDGKLLATGAEDRKIRVWDIAKRRVCHIFDGHAQEIYSLDFSRDGRRIVSGSGDKTMRIWDVLDGSSRTITINDTDSINNDSGVISVAISPDGCFVAAGSLDTVVRIWDVATGALLDRLRGHEDSVYSVAFTPDGRGLVSGSLDKTLKFWDIEKLLNDFNAHGPNIANKASTSKNAPSTVTSSLDFVGHKDFVLSVSVSNDGRWVISGSKDRSVHFWDAHNSALQLSLQGHKNSVISLDVNPLGGMLATGGGDNTARICTYNVFSSCLSVS